MKKHSNQEPGNLSYFGLSLLSYLKQNHPYRTADRRFIEARADMGAQVYEIAIKGGSNHIEAEEEAGKVLYRGLHFSPYSTLVNIIWDEFADKIPEEQARKIALRILPHPVLCKYELKDDFEETPEYDSLYSELTGVVAEFLDDRSPQRHPIMMSDEL